MLIFKNVWKTCFIFQHYASYILGEYHLDSWHWKCTKLNEPVLQKSGFQGISEGECEDSGSTYKLFNSHWLQKKLTWPVDTIVAVVSDP